MTNSEYIKYIGVNDHTSDYFEGQYNIPNGMSYNSYLILDEKIAVIDTVDEAFTSQWLSQLESELNGKKPDYLVIHHMECDHSGSIQSFLNTYPNTMLVGNAQTFSFLNTLFTLNKTPQTMLVKEKDILDLGKHKLEFLMAPMVHWPEVMMSYESSEHVLFSADAFGSFGANDTPNDDWVEEARRYYFGIVGKFGLQVQSVFKKLESYPIDMICSLHGPVLSENISYYLEKYNIWSKYEAEEDGICIAYTSVYGHTKEVVMMLVKALEDANQKVAVYDLARDDTSKALADAFRFNRTIFATTTYNGSIFPPMHHFLIDLVEHGYQNRTVGFIENGTWGPTATKCMMNILSPCKSLNFLEHNLTIKGCFKEDNQSSLQELIKDITK